MPSTRWLIGKATSKSRFTSAEKCFCAVDICFEDRVWGRTEGERKIGAWWVRGGTKIIHEEATATNIMNVGMLQMFYWSSWSSFASMLLPQFWDFSPHPQLNCHLHRGDCLVLWCSWKASKLDMRTRRGFNSFVVCTLMLGMGWLGWLLPGVYEGSP